MVALAAATGEILQRSRCVEKAGSSVASSVRMRIGWVAALRRYSLAVELGTPGF